GLQWARTCAELMKLKIVRSHHREASAFPHLVGDEASTADDHEGGPGVAGPSLVQAAESLVFANASEVRAGGLEPPRSYPPVPKTGASTNFATLAWRQLYHARCVERFSADAQRRRRRCSRTSGSVEGRPSRCRAGRATPGRARGAGS